LEKKIKRRSKEDQKKIKRRSKEDLEMCGLDWY